MTYQIIYADPPWKFNRKKTGGKNNSGAQDKYPVMSIDDMCKMDVASLCAPDCALLMWYVSSQPDEALRLARAWGFTVKTMNAFVWVKKTVKGKPFFGMGNWTRAGSESMLLAVRGKPKVVSKSVRAVASHKILRHSEKPAVFRERIVELFGDVPRLEMFARCAPEGWDVFGNEVANGIKID